MSDIQIDPNDSRIPNRIEKYVDRSKNSLVIIDNTPQVPSSKVEKLTTALLNKINKKIGKTPVIKIPIDEGTTLGFVFASFEKTEDADKCIVGLNGLKFDASHTFKTYPFSAWDNKYESVPDEYVAPEIDMEADVPTEGLYDYLCDDKQREQYFVRYHQNPNANNVEIYFNNFQVMANVQDTETTMDKVYSKKNWTTLFSTWSPLGTYFVTFHPKMIKLYGGTKWSLLGEFPHSEVQMLDFSPKEKYMITWGSELIVWDVQFCRKVRRVQIPFAPKTKCPYKWSHDEQFVVKLSENSILLYDLDQKMRLVQPDKERTTTIHQPRVNEISWSPTDNYFAYWIPEANNTPARVTITEVITKQLSDGTCDYQFKTIAQRNLYRVEESDEKEKKKEKLRWHPQGNYLACMFERKKKNNHIVSTYEIFRIRDKDCAVETLDLDGVVVAFGFEPKGDRFALIHGVSDVKLSVSFYTMNQKGAKRVQLLKRFDDREVNSIYWSPKGKYCLLAGLKQPFNGKLEFWNVQEQEMVHSDKHFMCTNVNWDASGRYVSTFVSQFYSQSSNGFKIWTFQGKSVVEKKYEKFYQFEWRPRPPSILSDKDLQKIEKKRSQWEKVYQEEELAILQKDERERKEKLNAEVQKYNERINKIREHFASHAEKRRELQLSTGACLDYTIVHESVEEIIDRKEVRLGRA